MSENEFVSELKDNRIRNTARITIVRVLSVVLVTIGPFVVRTLMIYNMGDAYAGLSSVFLSIISILNIADLGLADVIVFFLYDPMARGDKVQVEKYLNVLRRVYRFIGSSFIIIGCIITPFLPYLIKDDIPSGVNVYLVFLLYLIASSAQYFICPEILALANAAQRGDLSETVSIIGHTLVYIFQGIAIVVYHSFVLYYVAIIIQAVLTIGLLVLLRYRHFDEYHPHGELSQNEKMDIRNRVLSLFGHQMDEKFISGIDNLVISAIIGLGAVTIYTNYMYVVTSVSLLLTTVFTSMISSIGNAIVTEKTEDNYVRFKAVLWLNSVLVIWMTCCMLCAYQSFMTIWMGDRLFPMETVVLFCVYFFVSNIRRTVLLFKNASGMWQEDAAKPYVSMIINLILDIILVYYWGINGAIISSIVCILFIEVPWEGMVLYKSYFKRRVSEYIRTIIVSFACAFLVSGCAGLLCMEFLKSYGWIEMFFGIAIGSVVSVILLFIIYRNAVEPRIWIGSVRMLFGKKDD